MFYKKINLIPLLLVCLLLRSCRCTQLPIASISFKNKQLEQPGSKNQQGVLDKNRPYGPIQLSFSGCKLLGSISCMGKKYFLIQCKGTVSNVKSPSEGQSAVIGLSGGAALSAKGSIVEWAIKCKNEVEKLIWKEKEGGDFIYWNKVDKVGRKESLFIMKVAEDGYKKLVSNQYTLHMLYLQGGSPSQDPVISTPIQMDRKDSGQSLPDYQNIGLQAIDYGTKQTSDGISWLLKGHIAGSYIKDAKMGFLLVKEGVNPYDWVQKVVGSGEQWPTEPTLFNDELMVVPGRLRESDRTIEGDLLSSQAPIKSGSYKIFCYLIQDSHYYISQMEHILSKSAKDSSAQECAPSSITFTGDTSGLKTLDLEVCRLQTLGDIQDVKFSDFKIQYSINGQVEPLPADLQACLLFLQKGTIWRTAKVEALCKALHASNSTASMTDDATLCLVANGNKALAKSCLDFFSHETDYEFFTCLFGKEDHKLKFYTEKESIEVKEQEIQPPQVVPTPKLPNITITLDDTKPNITINNPFFSSAYATHTLPEVKLKLEASVDDQKAITNQGFLIDKAENALKIDQKNAFINYFLTTGKGIYSNNGDNAFLVFKKDFEEDPDAESSQLNQTLLKAYQYEDDSKNLLVISYWVQYQNTIIWSNSVNIELSQN